LKRFTFGHIRHYDCRNLIDEYPVFQAMLQDPDIFKHPQVVCCGYGVIWNDDLDVAAEEIWDNGVPIRWALKGK
jgi:hypothetical protein